MNELLLQSLEHEMGGVKVYETALKCAMNDDLREEWEKYLDETRKHERILRDVCAAMAIAPEQETPGRKIVRHIGAALGRSDGTALGRGEPGGRSTRRVRMRRPRRDQRPRWTGSSSASAPRSCMARPAKALQAAYQEVEDEEDEHLYHSKGWCRELWIESLGMKAVLPPPEERKHVKTAIGAARAEQASGKSR